MNNRNLTAVFVCSFLALLPFVLCFLSDTQFAVDENETSTSRDSTPRHFPHEIYTLDANITGSPLPKLLLQETLQNIGNSTEYPLSRKIHNYSSTETINTTGLPSSREIPDGFVSNTVNETGYPYSRQLDVNFDIESINTTGSPLSREIHGNATANATGSPLLREFQDFHLETSTEFSNVTDSQNVSNFNFPNSSSIMARQGPGGWRNCPGCGILQRNRIVGGRQANIAEFPWTISIRKSGVQHCGASIINKNYILSAAHCVRGHDIKKMEAIAAVTDVLDQRAFKTRIASAKIHENFEPTIYDYDVAVLKVTEPFPLNEGVKAVCLSDPQEDPTGQRAIVSGWGALRETDTVAPDYLSKLEVPVVNNDECAQAPGMRTQVITPRMLCAGFLDGSKDACIGDSGGPLVWNVRGQWKQIGIVSWGIGCARPGFYGIYSRVSMLLPWIASNAADGQC